MSTAAVSNASIYQELQSFYQNRQSDLQQLGGALQSGNLNGAQQAYSALAALGQSGPFATSEPFSKSSKGQAFEAIGQALQSGDLAGAKAAFAALTNSQSTSSTSSQAAPAAIVTLSNAQPTIATATGPGETSTIYQQLQAYQQQRQSDVAQLGQDLQAGNLSAAQQDFNALTTLGQGGPDANGQPFQNSTRAQDFQGIGQALQSGDIAGAQSAFATFAATFGGAGQGAHPVGPVAIAPPIVSAPPVAIGPAPVVVSTAAPPAASSGSGGAEIVINLGNASSASSSSASTSGSTAPEIVINLGPASGSSSGSPEDITIDFGGASNAGASSSSGSTTAGIVLDLGANGSSPASPDEITINLGSSSGAQITIDENQAQNSVAAEPLTINLNQQGNYELVLNLLNSTAAGQTSTGPATSGSSSAINLQA